MAGNSAADTPFAKLCGDCRYLISCLEDSLLKLRNSSDKFPMITVERPVPLSFKDWLASPKDGCVVCLELMDSLMQKYRSEVPLVDGLSPYLILLYNGYGPLELESKFIYFEVRAGPIVVTVEIVSRQAIQRPSLDPYSGTPRSLAFAREWIRGCLNSHSECKQPVGGRPPTRLLEVTKGKYRLIQSAQYGPCPTYATLSHCWGKKDMFKLTKTNIGALYEEIPTERLCKTFTDAFTILRAVEINHLWIDSLCIIQDDEQDWMRESALIAKVYGNAIVNIAATNAKDGSEGLFVVRDVNRASRQYLETGKGRIYKIMDTRMLEKWLYRTPLSSRVWAFQERYLAQRTLHFTGKRIFAECHHNMACEAWPDGLPKQLGLETFTFPRQYACDSWMQVVARYSEAELTFPKDKLVALSGVANKFQKTFQDQYVAGLWRKELIPQLCWSVDHANINKRPRTLETVYRAPSWSWASVDDPVSWRLGYTLDITSSNASYEPLAKVLEVQLDLLGGDSLGQVRDAKLQISCFKLIRTSVLKFLKDYDYRTLWALRRRANPPPGWQGLLAHDQEQVRNNSTQNTYLLLLLLDDKRSLYSIPDNLNICGLILAPAPGRINGYFTRVGVFDIEFVPFKTPAELMKHLSTLPDAFMDGSLYEETPGANEDVEGKYIITLV